MPTNLFLTLFRRAQVRWHLRRSVGDLLSRSDDHLLQDIGLTRYEAERLMAEVPPDMMPVDRPQRMQAVKGAACETC
jgi:uncharacterized protein YjiS (DUF1127 family)